MKTRWSCVLDAGVAAKWYLRDEPLVREADQLARDHEAGKIQIIVPDLFWAEFGNILWKAVCKDRIDPTSASEALNSSQVRIFPTFSIRPLLDQAVLLAQTHGTTVYDCIYLALAIECGFEFVTADEKLFKAIGDRYPVRWLGSLKY